MANFDDAITTILKHEGGFTDHPDDPGGATSYGISLIYLKQNDLKEYDLDKDGDLDVDDIRALTINDAMDIYYEMWWKKYNYGDLYNQEMATKIFDFSVNMGSRQAHKLAQRAARAVGFPLVDDGILGPRSFDTLNLIASQDKVPEFLAALRSEAAGFYRVLVAKKPKFKSFIKGWLNRAYS